MWVGGWGDARMALNIALIRHGKTLGNLQKKYVGSTDQPLCNEGIEELLLYRKNHEYPMADLVFSSPMLRCLETTKLVYPTREFVIIEELAECSFGDFEGKSYDELKDNPDYIGWVASSGESNTHNGEPTEAFKSRCVSGFNRVVEIALASGCKSISIVTHGGVIMRIMHHITNETNDFFHWQLKNGEFISFEFDQSKFMAIFE